MTLLLIILLAVVLAVVAAGLAYHYVLLIAGRRPPDRQGAGPPLHFAIALPAHNEAPVIAATIAALRAMDYPAALYDIHVVADHCDDDTAAAAGAAGAIAHERTDGPRGRKGYALSWLFDRLLSTPGTGDAIVVLDADSRVAPDFLSRIARAMADGADVVQGRHVIANPGASAFSALADADMRLNNRIRNQAKANLGLSARLMGDGMAFRRAILARHPWDGAASLTEDREYGIHLVAQGLKVAFAPDAVTRGQATLRWRDATAQRLRWYGGVFDLQQRRLGPLLAAAWRRRSLAALDLALELILPSFSALVALSLAALSGAVLLAAAGRIGWAPAAIAGALAVAAAAYPILGLVAERAPHTTMRALLFSPAYLVWRAAIGLRVRLANGDVPWVRTRRTEEQEATS